MAKSKAKVSNKKKETALDRLVRDPRVVIGMILLISVVRGGIVYLATRHELVNPYSTDLPEKRTAQLGSLLFDVPGKWQIGGVFSFYKDFFLDSSDRMNYSRVCYTVLDRTEGKTLAARAEELWAELKESWSLTVTDYSIKDTRILDQDAVELTYSGAVPGRNANGRILLFKDPADGSFLCLTYERVGSANSADRDFKKVVNSLRVADGAQGPTKDRWLDLNADTLRDYVFDLAMIEYNEGSMAGVVDSRHVYLYDRADQIIFYFTQTKEEPHTVESKWTPENLLVYRYIGDPKTGAVPYLVSSGYPDITPTQRNWFVRNNVHWAKGEELYTTQIEGNAGELVEQFLREFGAFA